MSAYSDVANGIDMMDDKYPASSLALVGTVLLFKEDLSLVVGGHGRSLPEPAMSPVFLKHEVTDEHFLDASKFDVYVDGMKVVECNDFVEAMMVYTCMFYVFNLVHPKALIKTLLFFFWQGYSQIGVCTWEADAPGSGECQKGH